MKQGVVFGIQHFSIHDGNGIRTNVFLKGCPLRCLWCHNPEGLEMSLELQYFANRCRQCGRCGMIYRRLTDTLVYSGSEKKRLEDTCMYGALEIVGQIMTTEEVLDEVKKDARFFQTSQGGITLSGGEPMLQFEFLYELLQAAKAEGLHTAIETSGYADQENYKKILPYVDEFLWDCKETNDERHRILTGVGNEKILSNLRKLRSMGAHVVLRCPIIPMVNDREQHLKGIAALLKELDLTDQWEIMPYHNLGIAKEKRMSKGRTREFPVPSEEDVEKWKQKIIREYQK